MITDVKSLPSRPSLEQYRKQSKELVESFKSGDADSARRIKTFHPRSNSLQDSSTPSIRFALADAQLVLAREHGFTSWPKFAKHIEALSRENSAVSQFERAAGAIATGDIVTLESLLSENPELIRARSTRAHRGMLLHYVGANGIEDYRQKTPENAVEVLKVLLKAGARVNVTADMYGKDTTLGLVATSVHPQRAGVQDALMQTLLDAGAVLDGSGEGGSDVNSCLANGRQAPAEFLADHGARLDLEGAAGVGRLDIVKSFFNADGSLKPKAKQKHMNDGFAWACEYGHTDVAEFLLQKGMKVDAKLRNHGNTGLHWAAHCAHPDIVRLLLEHNAPVNAKDESFGGTPLGWALHGWEDPSPDTNRFHYYEVVALLIAAGATVNPEWLENASDRKAANEQVHADPRMQAALRGEMPG